MVSVAWVDGGRDRGFASCCDGEMPSVRVVVVAAAREIKEKNADESEVRILVKRVGAPGGCRIACLDQVRWEMRG